MSFNKSAIRLIILLAPPVTLKPLKLRINVEGWTFRPKALEKVNEIKICASHKLSLNTHPTPRSLGFQGLNASIYIIIFRYGIHTNSGYR